MLDIYVIRAIIAIFILAINASIAGTFTIFKDIPFLVAGAAHAALAGAALAILLTMHGIAFDPLAGAIVFATGMAIFAANARKRNIAIGVGFAASMSMAVLFISMIREQAARVWGLLFGDLLLLTDTDIIMMATITIFVLIITLYFSHEFLFISFDEEGAKAAGINTKIFNYVLLAIIAISTVIIMKGIGAILVYAMLVAPAAAANEKAGSVIQVFGFSAIIALLAGFCGILLALYINVSPSAISALIATLIYFIAMMKK